MKSSHLKQSALFMLLVLALSGCAQLEKAIDGRPAGRSQARTEDKPRPRADKADKAERGSRAERPAPDRDDIALREGISLYNEGEFNAAIKRLNSGDMSRASLRNRLAALKYIAFSYCVTERQAQCRASFERALRLDPDFDLGPGEHGHPLWGPVFAKAKQSAAR